MFQIMYYLFKLIVAKFKKYNIEITDNFDSNVNYVVIISQCP